MKALAWKEWRENRMAIVFAAIGTLILFLVPAIAVLFHQASNLDVSTFVGETMIIWIASALLCGSNIMATEIGNGTLGFLSSLPVSRKDIWWTKLSVALAILACCILASAAAMSLLCLLGLPLHIIDGSNTTNENEWRILIQSIIQILAGTIPIFAMGSVMTMLVDRSVSAFMGAAVAGITLYLAILGTLAVCFYQIFGTSDINFNSGQQLNSLVSFVAFATIVLLVISFNIFTRGETLKTHKRYRILGGYFLPPIIISSATFVSWLIIRG